MNELKKGKDGNKASVMRVEYINLLRENGLEIEIEVFFPCILVSLRLCLENMLVFLPKSLNF